MRSVLAKTRKLLHRLPSIWKYSLLTLILSKLGDLANVYVSMFLVMDKVDQNDLGAILPLQNLTGLAAVPLTVTFIVGIKFIHLFESRGEHGKTRKLLRDLVLFNGLLTLFMLLYTYRGYQFVAERMNIEGQTVLWALLALATTNAWLPLLQNFARGLKQWKTLILTINIVAPMTRVVMMALLLGSFGVAGYLSAQTIKNLTIILIFAWATIRHLRAHAAPLTSYADELPAISRYLLPILLVTLATCLQRTVEPWVLRQRLSEVDSGAFYYLSTLGNIPRYISGALLPFVFVFVADKHEKGESTARLHLHTLAVTFAGGIAASLLLAVLGPGLTQLRPSWAQFAAYTPFLLPVCIIQTVDASIAIHLAHENACRRFRVLLYYLPILFLEALILYGLNLWHLAAPHLPDPVWRWVYQNLVFSFEGTISFLVGVRVVLMLCIGMHLGRRYAFPSHA